MATIATTTPNHNNMTYSLFAKLLQLIVILITLLLGVLIIGVLRNGLVLNGVSPFAQEFLIGLVIVVAVAIDRWTTPPRR